MSLLTAKTLRQRIGIEYMITPRLFASLPPDERSLWHSHVYEVKSGMLVMPNSLVPQTLWDTAENKETGEIITFYGKTYRLWRTDREDSLPPGGPRLMTRFTRDGQLDLAKVGERDGRLGRRRIREGRFLP
ncbi:hypothetical protein MAA_06668 [Metarhizium robertsii ARSEF 23]|uniref:DUF1264 domain protein n=1 Tax=Metarhizium robertsii (strain ARSEF 23 / ATCC MYA-3075) TaxID=655844 RepID=E9F319_METRA|nr:uncharacterized protein MAA_06668 [Metarhizium robertsii ARSEF 23]EFY97885.2 hypothetical protein MAA_06668 [Metarhizium robertsii ARSEF 23]